MADNNKENRMSIDDFDFAHEDANDDTSMLVHYLVTRLHQAMGDPALQGEVQQQLHAYGILPPIQQERGPERFQDETSKRGLSTKKGAKNPYQEHKQLLEGKTSSKKKGHAQHERSPSREREESESSDESMEDVAPRRRRAQRSPTPTSRRGLLIVLTVMSPKEKRRTPKRRRRERGHPLLPPHHPLPLWMKVAGILLKKNKGEDTKVHMLLGRDKVLAFIQQFDATFGDEGFTESSKLRHVAMHFQKSARQWWASLQANGEAPKTWKTLRASIMKQFLASDAKDKVLTEWRSLKLSPYESIHKYVDKFWDLHLKATVYKKIDFEEQKQQFCAGLPENMNKLFIEKFSLIAGPLHDLTKKNVKYVWTEKRQQAFDTLKQKLISQPVLALPNLSKPFEVQCDACGDCLGAAFLQEGHAIAYESRRLSSDELILGIYEKELLADLHALDSWKDYLLGTPFILRMDHQSLKYFMMQTKLFDKQMRSENFLSRFNFHIAHIAGKHNQVANALSRRPKVNAVSIATHNDLSLMIDEYAIDPNFKDVNSAIALGKKEEPFTLQDDYIPDGNRLCITRSLREKVMFESHAPPYVGHRGIQTTMKAIETYFYWPIMKGDIQDYVSKCVVCQKTEYDIGKQPGLLQPLPIPDSPWESISMDFIFGLPKSIHGNTRIWTIVNRFSKQAHFIPVKKTIIAHQMATLFITQDFKDHGLPMSIVSDRDPRMTSNFWKGLLENLGTRSNFSSAYHPQTDGQSEIANLKVLDLLKAYVTEVDQCSQWEKYLPLVEYAYNNTVHTSIGKAPYEVIEGRPKSPLLLKVHGKIFAADEYS
ncbi:hypothetical protein L7F22_020742 [Adiantum nelumboides]|nr:hypothetical protein [Adiantum nelumboides]